MVPVFKYTWIRSKFEVFILDGFSNLIITYFLKLNSHCIFLNSLLKLNMLTYSPRACFVPPWSLSRDVFFRMYFPTPSFKACSDRSLFLGFSDPWSAKVSLHFGVMPSFASQRLPPVSYPFKLTMTFLETGTVSCWFWYASHMGSVRYVFLLRGHHFTFFFFPVKWRTLNVLSSFSFLCHWAFNIKNKKSPGSLTGVAHHGFRDFPDVSSISDVCKCFYMIRILQWNCKCWDGRRLDSQAHVAPIDITLYRVGIFSLRSS